MKTIALLFLVFISLCAYSQVKAPFDYPVKPGSKEWATFKSHEEMVSACQIPVEILSQLPTKALVSICINYPLRYDYYAYNDVRKGISIVIKSFNGFNELSKRPDATRELIEVYKQTAVLKAIPLVESNDDSLLKIGFIELLIADDLFLNNLSPEELNELKILASVKYAEKQKAYNLYSIDNQAKSLLLGAMALVKINATTLQSKQVELLSSFIRDFNRSDEVSVNNVFNILVYETLQ